MARKKKAPVVRNIINDTPNTYRAINRMNGIVTMVEYTGEDDIKAYELEPTYRELGGGGGGGGVAYKAVFNPITEEIEPSEGFYIIDNYDADVVDNNETFILEINMNLPIYLEKSSSGSLIELVDSDRKNKVSFINNQAVISLDPTYGPYEYPSSYIFLYATYFQENENGGNE